MARADRKAALAELGGRLHKLWEGAGEPTYVTVARAVKDLSVGTRPEEVTAKELSRRTVEDWLKGVYAPSDEGQFELLLRYLQGVAGTSGGTDAEWRELWLAARREGTDRRGNRRDDHDGERANKHFLRRHLAPEFLADGFVGRKEELREIGAVEGTGVDSVTTAADVSYQWWQSPPGGGKSALLARFVKQLPRNVDVLCYFASAVRGTNSRSAFLAYMARQLGELRPAREELRSAPLTPEAWWELLDAAVEQSAARGRGLVLVVDGLTEDRAWFAREAEGEGSIAALLPSRPRAGLRVVVSSRPTVRLPIDVPDDHPLSGHGVVRELRPYQEKSKAGQEASGHAEAYEEVLREEPAGLRGSELGRALLPFLVVAQGGLRYRDLAELVRVGVDEVEGLLGSFDGRCVTPDNRVAGTYGLRHRVLRDAAEQGCGEAELAAAVERLHSWADEWQEKGWPRETSRYLLTDYLSLLRGDDRVDSVVLDARWQLRLVAEEGRELAFARLAEVLPDSEERLSSPEQSGLGLVAGVSVSRELLSYGGGVDLPPRLVRENVGTHGASLARQLALAASGELARVVGLAVLAHELSARDLPGVERLTQEAAKRSGRVRKAVVEEGGERELLAELAFVSSELHEKGLMEPAEVLLRFVFGHQAASWEATARAGVSLDAAFEEDANIQRLSDYAESKSLTDADGLAEAVEIWAALYVEVVRVHGLQPKKKASTEQLDVKSRMSDHRRELKKRLEKVHRSEDTPTGLATIDVPALVARVLAERSATTARREHAWLAVKVLKTAFADPDALDVAERAYLRLELSTTLARVVEALLKTGGQLEYRVAEARELLEAVPEEYHTSVLGLDIREAAYSVLAEAGAEVPSAGGPSVVEDRSEARSRETAMRAEAVSGWLPVLAESLGAVGEFEELRRLTAALLEDDLVLRTRLSASAAVGCAHGGYEDLAGELARNAMELSADIPDPALRGVVAQALAYAGEVERAVALASRREPLGAMSRSEARRQVVRSEAAVAVAIVGRAPETAAALVDRRAVRLDELLGSGRATRYLPEAVELLLGRRCAREPGEVLGRVLRACLETDAQVPEHGVMLTHRLLEASGYGGQLPPLSSESRVSRQAHTAHRLPMAELCVWHVVRGDTGAAHGAASHASTAKDRSAALAAAAGQLLRAPVTLGVVPDWSLWDPAVLRFRALARALTDSTARTEQDVAAAHRFADEVLAGEYWRYALSLLPSLALPEAVVRISGLVRGHVQEA